MGFLDWRAEHANADKDCRCSGNCFLGLQNADAGGLSSAEDVLLLRLGWKKVLDEGNDAFGGFYQNPVFVLIRWWFG